LLAEIDPNTEEIRATVVGLFETKVPIDGLVFLFRPDEPHKIGYGHLGGHPAQIIVRTMYDMSIKKKPLAR